MTTLKSSTIVFPWDVEGFSFAKVEFEMMHSHPDPICQTFWDVRRNVGAGGEWL